MRPKCINQPQQYDFLYSECSAMINQVYMNKLPSSDSSLMGSVTSSASSISAIVINYNNIISLKLHLQQE